MSVIAAARSTLKGSHLRELNPRPTVYEAAVNELYGCDASQAVVLPRFAIVDPFLEQMAIATATALRERREDGLYIDSLAQMMAVHLASTHSSRSSQSAMPHPAASLPSWKMRRLMDQARA